MGLRNKHPYGVNLLSWNTENHCSLGHTFVRAFVFFFLIKWWLIVVINWGKSLMFENYIERLGALTFWTNTCSTVVITMCVWRKEHFNTKIWTTFDPSLWGGEGGTVGGKEENVLKALWWESTIYLSYFVK